MMDYQQTLDYLFNSLPMYHRIGKAAYKADITNTVQLMEHLGNPEKAFKSIHVAGTNGKGSVSHFLASILQESGYKVGLYTSPHLVDFRERIRINGEKIKEQHVVDFVAQNKQYMEGLQLSFFEMTVGLAFDYFASNNVDIAVIEVGMGGRLDSTNVITPELSIITNIGFDHTNFLGNTLELIAGEKAGIIKPNIPIIIGETHPETKEVFEKKAKECSSFITFADQHYKIISRSTTQSLLECELSFVVKHENQIGDITYTSPLSGSYQLKNIATVFQSIEILNKLGYNIKENHILKGISRVVLNTGLHGRWEKIGTNPLTICETAHNADGVNAMLSKLAEMPYKHLHLIYGCVNDKDYGKILNMMPKDNVTYYYSQPSVPRGLPVEELIKEAKQLNMPGKGYCQVKDAIADARSNAQEGDLVLITGSIFLIADALEGLL